MQRTIDLTDEQLRELEQVAAREHRSVDDVLQRAVGDYLARRHGDWADWNRRFDAVVARFRAEVPEDLTPEQIEAEITANWREHRA
jgi:Arc/MetJ-type ribon-helix-helix transcriptional regulator